MIKSRIAWLAMDDDGVTDRLLDIAKRHCKLALEHSHKDTGQDRREAIRAEIERLRVERDSLLSSFEQEGVK